MSVKFNSNGLDQDFLDQVAAEIDFARDKFPSSDCVLTALTEEVGELAQACLKVAGGKWPKQRIWEEAIQVAAMAMRVATEGDATIKLSGKAAENQ